MNIHPLNTISYRYKDHDLWTEILDKKHLIRFLNKKRAMPF